MNEILLNKRIAMEDGRSLNFVVSPNSPRPACFALSIRKSGSSLFSNLVSEIAKVNQMPIVDIPGAMFDHGYRYRSWNDHEDICDLIWPGNAYIGFRDAPVALFDDPVFRHGKKVFLVRDPRDVLVSEYFSNAYSHQLPKRSDDHSLISEEREKALVSEVGDYVLSRVDALNKTANSYAPIIGDKNIKVFRYEDVIFEKRKWIEDMCAHLEMDVPAQRIEKILSWADVVPTEEIPTEFIRKVTPGDYLAKLTPDNIQRVNESLSPVWTRLGYSL